MSSIARPIYGTPDSGSNVVCFSLPSITTSLQTIGNLAGTFSILIDKFYPTAIVRAPIIGSMSARGYISPKLYVRIVWRNMNPGVVFTGTPQQLYEIKDIYINSGLDWTNDKLFAVPTAPAPEPAPTV